MSSYDVIVIGAGIIALEASKVESDAWFAFAVTAVDYYPQLVARLQADGAGETGYAATDELVVAISADEDAQQGYHTLDWRTGERGLFGRESIRTILKNRAYLGYVSSGGQEF